MTITKAMADGNREYERTFGHVYLVSAAGRSAQEMLDFLHERLGNDPVTEREIVRTQLATINRNGWAGCSTRRHGTARRPDEQPDHPRPGRRPGPARRSAYEVRLEVAGRARSWRSGRTDDDGRIPGLVAEPLMAGDYRLVFDTGGYHRATGQTGFYPEVAITFTGH